MDMAAMIRRYPLVAYFFLAFGISWDGIALVAGPLALSGGQLMLGLLIAVSAGPATASVVLTGIVDGRAGYSDLGARLTRWRLAPRWYAAALLLNPVALLVVLAALSVASPEYVPDILTNESPLARSMGFAAASPLLIVGLAIGAGLVAGLFEELGWTGFATPRLLALLQPGTTGHTVDIVWWGAARGGALDRGRPGCPRRRRPPVASRTVAAGPTRRRVSTWSRR